MQITEDLILGARFRSSLTGTALLRIFDVGGLVPGRDTLAQAASAIDSASGARIPRYGDPHPAVAGLYANQIDAEPIRGSQTAARVTVRYGPPEVAAIPGAVSIRITGAQNRKLLARNPDGSLIVVKYTDPAGNLLQDRVQIPILSPNTVLEFTRQEPASPLTKSAQYRRTLNSNAWQSGAAKTWLCRAIDGRSLASRATYEVRYLFEYDPDGWERIEYFVDRYTGKIPDDVQFSDGNDKGIAKIQPYALRDYAQLGLPNAY